MSQEQYKPSPEQEKIWAAYKKYESKELLLNTPKNIFDEDLPDIFRTAKIFGVARSGRFDPPDMWYVGELPGRSVGLVEPMYISKNKEGREYYFKNREEFTPEITEAIETAISRAEKLEKGEELED